MAIKTKASTQVEEALAAVASMNPDNMLQGGLVDDFDGLVTKCRLVPWDYNGKLDHHVLAVAVTIKPDDDAEFTQHYSAGDLDAFEPSMDGRTSVDLANWDPATGTDSVEGIYARKVGRRDQLNNTTNWAQFVGALLDAGFDRAQLTPAVTFMEGVYGHWNRIQQKKRSGIVIQPATADGRARNTDILVITEIKQAPATAGKAAVKPAAKAAPAAKATAAPAAAASAATNGNIDDRLRELVTEAVLAAGDTGLTKQKLPGLAIKHFQGADKGRAVKRVSETEFLESSDTWVFDGDAGLLLPIE